MSGDEARSRFGAGGAIAAMALAALLFAGGCGAKPQHQPPATQAAQQARGGQQGLPATTMRIGWFTFDLEIARSTTELETGLMDRDSMPANHGMIFVFDRPQQLHFWMKDTRIPLDVIFVAGDGTVDSVQHMKPYDLTDTISRGIAQYAIELNWGAADAAGVKPGDHLDIPAAALPR
ncbi:MAG TPA: DUF192 domain-containing protein [Tepidisphaeraceae bacterium]|jgi:hypothetical protein|nr:DUF192 domain-containing protein [Tepidisphaeraceae bacterium]